MKHTIRNLSFAFTGLICFSLFSSTGKTIISTINKNEATAVNKQKDSTGNLIIYDKNNQVYRFNDSTNYFIILKNNRFCNDCFRSLNEYVEVAGKEMKAVYVVINLCDSVVLERKKLLYADKELMPAMNEYCFQYYSENANTIFDELHVKYTPEIILINKGKVMHIPNERIFDENLNIRPEVQLKIDEQLK